MAQESVGTVTETVTTRRDLNGRQVVSKRVMTHLARTNGEEQVVVETYLPSIEGERLTLSRRVRRATTETSDGSQIVEETEERNQVASSEPLRVVRRSVTTVRRNGRTVRERGAGLRLDVNGRFVPVRTKLKVGPAIDPRMTHRRRTMKMRIPTVATSVWLTLLGTIALAQSVTYDYDRAAKFSTYRTTPGLAAPS